VKFYSNDLSGFLQISAEYTAILDTQI